MDPKLLQPYSPAETEDRIYNEWEKNKLFEPGSNGATEQSERFAMVLPPPNVTGELHLGHAAMLTIEDIMTRYARMRGKYTLWLPGTDHAAIATQSKVEKLMEKEGGKRRHDLGREEFLKQVNAFAKQSHDTIVNQTKKMGASLDWSREAFTLDEPRSLAVRTAFKQMYEAGLIYRGHRIVNWDPKGQTTISDDEVVYEERLAKLYTFRYSKDFPIAIATTRPETKVGDVAVAVHPDDKRYSQYLGQIFTISDFCGVKLNIKIVASKEVDPAFGTGALGVTPAHSQADWTIAEQENLPRNKQVINEFAKMTPLAGEKLMGKKTTEAREIIVAWLKENNLFEKEEDAKQNISLAERTNGVIEPLPKLQWFIGVNKEFPFATDKIKGIARGQMVTLKEVMKKVVENDQIEIIPDRFNKIYDNWIDNLHDWCISRQIWYGHRIPVWYHEPKCIPRPGHETDISKCLELVVSVEEPICEFCDAKFIQDPDTLDTWFSSGLWTFSTLGWPNKTKDLELFHPTTILETGYDIIFFWVARMILMTGFLLGDIPFHQVYLHGLVRDQKNRKLSKSLGNAGDPVEMISKYGADAVRMSLIIGTAPGNDSKIWDDKIRAYKHFANKIWNATRFVQTNCPPETGIENANQDHPRLAELDALVRDITADMDNYRYYLAGEKLYHYFWHTFADKIIEAAKKQPELKPLLPTILITCLKLLHPFMPFITEELWQIMKMPKPLIITPWPIK